MAKKLKMLKPTVKTVCTDSLPVIHAGSWRTDKMTTSERGYGTRWQKRRAQHLRENPVCVYCLRAGCVTAATVCDHITPHRGDPALFDGPIQSLCASCHSSAKAKEEAKGE